LSHVLATRAEVADVLAHFCQRIDAYDIQGVANLFTEGCVTDYGPSMGGRVLGREAFQARLRRSQARFRRTHHQLGQITYEVNGNEASTVAYATCWHETWDGIRKIARIQYHDRLVKDHGTWLIAERRTLAAGSDGFDEVEWNWVPRQQPAEDVLPDTTKISGRQ
jgi:ketosteroid isomerase-like protein